MCCGTGSAAGRLRALRSNRQAPRTGFPPRFACNGSSLDQYRVTERVALHRAPVQAERAVAAGRSGSRTHLLPGVRPQPQGSLDEPISKADKVLVHRRPSGEQGLNGRAGMQLFDVGVMSRIEQHGKHQAHGADGKPEGSGQ
jgi:hypothetical protein